MNQIIGPQFTSIRGGFQVVGHNLKSRDGEGYTKHFDIIQQTKRNENNGYIQQQQQQQQQKNEYINKTITIEQNNGSKKIQDSNQSRRENETDETITPPQNQYNQSVNQIANNQTQAKKTSRFHIHQQNLNVTEANKITRGTTYNKEQKEEMGIEQRKYRPRQTHANRIHKLLATPNKDSIQHRKYSSIFNTPQKFGSRANMAKKKKQFLAKQTQNSKIKRNIQQQQQQQILSVSGLPILNSKRRCSTSQAMHMEKTGILATKSKVNKTPNTQNAKAPARNHSHHVFINHLKPSTSYIRGGGYHGRTSNANKKAEENEALSIAPLKRFSEPINFMRRPVTPQVKHAMNIDSSSEIDEELSEVLSLSSFLSRTSSSCESVLHSNDLITMEAIRKFKTAKRVNTPEGPIATNLEDLYNLYMDEENTTSTPRTPCSIDDEEFPEEVLI